MSPSNAGEAERSWKWWVGYVLIPLLAALIAAATAIYLANEGPAEPEGTISYPTDGAAIAPAFTAEGTLDHIPDDHHVWLAVEIDGLLFPKEPEVSIEPHWLEQAVEAGALHGRRFSVVLLAVGESGHRQIEGWLRHGRSSGDYPGLAEIRESTMLDAATQLVVAQGVSE